MTDRQVVRDALQAGYGDTTQTVLDEQVAGNVMDALRERGWCSLQEVAAIVLAAGGEVRVRDDVLRRVGDLALEVSTDYSDPSMPKVLRARTKP